MVVISRSVSLCIGVVLVSTAFRASAQIRTYRLTTISMDSSSVYPEAISDAGIVGGSVVASNPRAFRWDSVSGVVTWLSGTNGPPHSSHVEDVGERGHLVGYVQEAASSLRKGAVWIPFSQGPIVVPFAENGRAQVAGKDQIYFNRESIPLIGGRSIYEDPGFVNFFGVSLHTFGEAGGHAAGTAFIGGQNRAFGALEILPSFAGELESIAIGGGDPPGGPTWVAGRVRIGSNWRAATWTVNTNSIDGVLRAPFGNHPNTLVEDANWVFRLGSSPEFTIVGTGTGPLGSEAFSWTEATGFVPLSSRVVGPFAGTPLLTARGMNRFGQIVGTYLDSGGVIRGYVLTPSDLLQISGQLSIRGLSTSAYIRRWGIEVTGNQGGTSTSTNSFGLTDDHSFQCVLPSAGLTPGQIQLDFAPRYCLKRAVPDLQLSEEGVFGFSTQVIPGDLNEDNEVGPGDFSLFAAAFGSQVSDPSFLGPADFDLDEEIGPSDFSVFAGSFGELGD